MIRTRYITLEDEDERGILVRVVQSFGIKVRMSSNNMYEYELSGRGCDVVEALKELRKRLGREM